MQVIKYDPDQWVTVAKNIAAPCPKNVHVRLSKPGTVSVDLGDGFNPVAYGSEFKIVLPRGGEIKADVEMSIFAGSDTTVEQLGVPLTNFDKRPGMSSVERMIATQFKERELKERLKREARRAADQLHNKKRVEEGKQEELPEELVDPIPPEPVVETEAPAETPTA